MSLQDATIDLFLRAGWKISTGSRSYVPSIDDTEIECLLVRAQEMARYVETGALDAGITGHDWVVETGAAVQELAELVYAKQRLARVRWVLAVPEDSPMRDARDLEGKVIATEVVKITSEIFGSQRSEGACGFFLGSDGSESAATRGRDCRGDGNGIVAARKPLAGDGHGAGVGDGFH